MSQMQEMINATRIKVREFLNPYLGKWRSNRLVNKNFTIISNNCWGGHLYRYFNLPYDSPTIGLFFFTEDYIKFVYNLRHYIDTELTFISIEESKYCSKISQSNRSIPIGVIDDVEIFFLHYHSKEEAYEKWNRRKARIHWDNIYYKMSEQNMCTVEHLKKFDNLPTEKKFVFVSQDYQLQSQIVFKDWLGRGEVLNDTTNFRRYINIINWLNGCSYKLKQK